jgi:hypothetical protein
VAAGDADEGDGNSVPAPDGERGVDGLDEQLWGGFSECFEGGGLPCAMSWAVMAVVRRGVEGRMWVRRSLQLTLRPIGPTPVDSPASRFAPARVVVSMIARSAGVRLGSGVRCQPTAGSTVAGGEVATLVLGGDLWSCSRHDLGRDAKVCNSTHWITGSNRKITVNTPQIPHPEHPRQKITHPPESPCRPS